MMRSFRFDQTFLTFLTLFQAARRARGHFFFDRYFKSMAAVGSSFLEYMQDLLHIDNKGYEHWNGVTVPFSPELRVFKQAKEDGFTVVILTFDRFEYLVKVIRR